MEERESVLEKYAQRKRNKCFEKVKDDDKDEMEEEIVQRRKRRGRLQY